MQKKHFPDKKINITLAGIHNNIKEGEVVNGIYTFSMNVTLSKVYLLIVEESDLKILDISSREKLDTSLKLLLDYCDKNNYCETIINDYVSRLIRGYYNLNKWQGQRKDLNCEEGRGVTTTKRLP